MHLPCRFIFLLFELLAPPPLLNALRSFCPPRSSFPSAPVSVGGKLERVARLHSSLESRALELRTIHGATTTCTTTTSLVALRGSNKQQLLLVLSKKGGTTAARAAGTSGSTHGQALLCTIFFWQTEIMLFNNHANMRGVSLSLRAVNNHDATQ